MTRDLRDATLVLGGSGFLGAHVVATACALARAEENAPARDARRRPEVYSASRDPGAAPGFGEASDDVKLRSLDLSIAQEADALLAEVEPARIVCCAALALIPACEERPDRARARNVELPARLARWCAASGARLVHVSTDLVFGQDPPPAGGFREEDPPSPVSGYGRTKARGETAALEACPRALVVRLPLLYGSSGGRGRGASDSILAAVARGERPVAFTDEWRTPLEAGNAARALLELLDSEASGIVHVAGPDRVSRLELAFLVLGRRGLARDEAPARIRASTRAEAGMDASRPADTSLDSSRARALLATPLLGLREGLARAHPAPAAKGR